MKPVMVRNAIYGIHRRFGGVESMKCLVLWALGNGLPDDYANDCLRHQSMKM